MKANFLSDPVPEPLQEAENRIRTLEAELSRSRAREAALRENELRYRSLFANHHAVMLIIDPETAWIIDANPAASDFYGYPMETLTAMRITEINTLTEAEVFAEMRRARNEERNYFRFRHLLASGEIRDVEVFSGPIHQDGRTLLYSIIHDISRRCRAERRICRQQADLEALSNALTERLKELQCLYSLSDVVEYGGPSLDDLLAPAVRLLPPALRYPDRACARIRVGDRRFQSDPFEMSISRLVEPIRVEGNVVGDLTVCYRHAPTDDDDPFPTEERNLITTIAQRIGRAIEWKRSAEALRESESRFRSLVENCLTGITIIQDGRAQYKNPEQCRLLGDLRTHGRELTFDRIHEDDRERIQRCYGALQSGEVASIDEEFRIHPSPEAVDDIEGKLKWVHCRATRIDYRGREAILLSMVDVTRAKELEQMLRMEEKMASLGRVAAGMAHEIRNPLSGINIYLNTLRRLVQDSPDADRAVSIIDQVLSASDKIEATIRRVIDFAKPGAPRKVIIDLRDVVKEAVGLSVVTLRKARVRIVEEISPEASRCRADPQLLVVALLNLITNAAQAMAETAGRRLIRITSSSEDGRIHLKVADNGPGVPPALRDKIFDPFYTTKSDSPGIGLSITQRIALDHGGCLLLGDQNGGGAEFVIDLPIGEAEPAT